MAKQWVRCKSCGYVMEEGKLGDVCPACGVKRIMFAPDTEKISDKRRGLLDKHIHPIVVHLPQGVVTLLLFLSVAALVLPGTIREQVLSTITVLSIITPFTVVAAFLSGLLDGKTRFKKLSTPYIKTKIAAGIALFVCTVAAAILVWPALCTACWQLYVYIPVMVVALGSTAVLGKIGASLATARFPG